MLKLAEKDIETIIVTLFYIFKKLKKRMNMLKGNMNDIKKTQIKLLEMKTMSEIGLMKD